MISIDAATSIWTEIEIESHRGTKLTRGLECVGPDNYELRNYPYRHVIGRRKSYTTALKDALDIMIAEVEETDRLAKIEEARAKLKADDETPTLKPHERLYLENLVAGRLG